MPRVTLSPWGKKAVLGLTQLSLYRKYKFDTSPANIGCCPPPCHPPEDTHAGDNDFNLQLVAYRQLHISVNQHISVSHHLVSSQLVPSLAAASLPGRVSAMQSFTRLVHIKSDLSFLVLETVVLLALRNGVL